MATQPQPGAALFEAALPSTSAPDKSLEDEVAVSMDQNAFGVFYEKTSGPLWGYLSRLTGQQTAADDLLQESYLRFLNARRPVMNAEQEKQYLFRIATNLVRDRWRSKHPEVPLPEIASAEHLEHSTWLRSDFARAFAGL